MDKIIHVVEKCTQIRLHPRHPYAGELVFAAFSGSHQDAINKCLDACQDAEQWQVAYLPIDPRDVGRSYQEVIRINSQSGKGGVAYVLRQDYGIKMPRWMQVDFSPIVQKVAERSETEVTSARIAELFNDTYLNPEQKMKLKGYQVSREEAVDAMQATLLIGDQELPINGKGRGVLDAFVTGLSEYLQQEFVIVDYSEHTLGNNEQSEAMAYVQININGQRVCGAGKSHDILGASLNAVLNALVRSGERIDGHQTRVA